MEKALGAEVQKLNDDVLRDMESNTQQADMVQARVFNGEAFGG